jgi:energy-coupling factor transport system ATP-binding protein
VLAAPPAVHDVGITVIVAEHRLERAVQYADGSCTCPEAVCRWRSGLPAEIMASSPVAPPVVELGRSGRTPLPLSIRDARRAARPCGDRLASLARP